MTLSGRAESDRLTTHLRDHVKPEARWLAAQDVGPRTIWDVSSWFPTYGAFLTYLLMMVIQFPASLIVTAVLPSIEAAVLSLLTSHAGPRGSRMFFTLFFAHQWIVAAVVNYLIWVYALPAGSRRLDSRWPFERVCLRR